MKRVREEDADSAADSSESEDSLELTVDRAAGKHTHSKEIVNVDFEFFDMKTEDFWGVRSLLHGGRAPITLVPDMDLTFTDMTDLIVEDTSIGTIVKTEAEGAPLALLTALNLRVNKDKPFIKAVEKLVLGMSGTEQHKKLAKSIFYSETEQIGLIVESRYMNFPDELVSKTYSCLNGDLEWAVKNELTEERKNNYKYNKFLFLFKSAANSSKPDTSADAQMSSKKKKKKQKKSEGSFIEFFRFEDHYFLKNSIMHLTSDVLESEWILHAVLVDAKVVKSAPKDLEQLFIDNVLEQCK